MDMAFGHLLTPNITPDAATGFGNCSADELYRELHQGVNQRGQDLFREMPFDFYTRHAPGQRRDPSLPAQRRPGKQCSGRQPPALSLQPALIDGAVARAPFHLSAGSFKPDPGKSAAWSRGACLVEGLGHCSACHSPCSALGGIGKDKA
jgi:hypothetical protein